MKNITTMNDTEIETAPRAAGEPGSLIIKFKDKFHISFRFGKDVSGYDGIMAEMESFAPGEVRLQIMDCLNQVWALNRKIPEGDFRMLFDFKDFECKSEHPQTKTPASLEKLELAGNFSRAVEKLLLQNLKPFGSRGLNGPSTAVDPAFDIYHKQPWDKTVADIKELGFTAVDFIIVYDLALEKQREIIQKFHEAGISVALRIYPTTDFEAYEKHPDWRQISLDGSSRHDWRVYLCPNSEEFTNHICEEVKKTVRAVNYNAIELAEPWFEVWGGAYPDNPTRGKYGCLCSNCRKKFQDLHGVDPKELFDKKCGYYFEKEENREIYQKWQDFRVDTIIRFSGRIYEAAKEARPGIKIIHMHLADCSVEPGRSREYQAMDIEQGLREIRPDVMIIEDAWQDWTRPELRPDFVKGYAKAYIDQIRSVSPDVIIKAHADIGSLSEMQRRYSWMREFSALARAGGFDAPIYYEYSIGDFSE